MRPQQKIICALRYKCGMLKNMQEDWATAFLVPIYNIKDNTKPQSLNPRALLSHVRKATKAATAVMISKQYKMNDGQLGFQRETCTKTAIVRNTSNAKGLNITAVLDLKSDYDTVRRDGLLNVIKNSMIEMNLTNIVCLTLQAVQIKTQGDKIGTRKG